MTTQEKLEVIRQACIRANPEIAGDWSGCDVCGTMCGVCDNRFIQEKTFRPIRLADVLLALQETDTTIVIQTYGCWMIAEDGDEGHDWYEKRGRNWNLCADDLTQQSEETINFLYELLK